MKRDYRNLTKETVVEHTAEHFIEKNRIMNDVTDNKLYLKHKALYDSIDSL